MKRTAVALVAGAFAASALLSSTASASGPAPPGKAIVEVSCEGLGTFTVTALRHPHGNGAFQIVGEKGHGREVSFTFTLTDVTTGEQIFSDSGTTGGGRAHANQSTVTCTGLPFEQTASSFFGEEELPEGVRPNDIVRGQFEAQVIVKR